MKIIILVSSFLFSAPVLALCQPPGATGVFQRTPLPLTTQASIECDYALENAGHARPRIGLALSGGGTRAAYFSLGILSGLSRSGVLEHVDVISSVSGGGYAAYWYFARLMEGYRRHTGTDTIFGDCAPTWWVKTPLPTNGVDTRSKSDIRDDALLKTTLDNAVAFEGFQPCNKASESENTANYIRPDDKYVWQAHLARWPDLFNTGIINVTGNKQGKLKWNQLLPVIKEILLRKFATD
ncbi:patatin-like phospholipase family protein, partial [Acerihabitans sp.]|uniref:patatin-like phospholipase family protein n=1 Tax=Acerihabitans sp. TaxID=2811394 RepID=UPI002ED793D0